MKKVFASDFDGTLFFRDAQEGQKLPLKSVEKIKEYQANGHLFGICTGRSIAGLVPAITGILKPDFYITSSGANILNGDLQEIQKQGMSKEIADSLVKEFRPHGYRIILQIEGAICSFSKLDFMKTYYLISSIEEAPKGLIHQLSVRAENFEEAASFVANVNERIGNKVQAFQNVMDVDIVPKGCSKGIGVNIIREYFQKQYGEVKLYGIGDSVNDLPLVEAADVSYSFPYAPEVVQQKVDNVVETVVEALNDSMKD